jgi:hypothetical protein
MTRDRDPRPVLVTRPAKPTSHMCDEELDRWATEVVEMMRRPLTRFLNGGGYPTSGAALDADDARATRVVAGRVRRR